MLHDEANLPTSTTRDRRRDAQPESERKRFPHLHCIARTSHNNDVDIQIRRGLRDDKGMWLRARAGDRGCGGQRARDGGGGSGLRSRAEGRVGSERAWGRRAGSGCWELGRARSRWARGGSLRCALEIRRDSARGLG